MRSRMKTMTAVLLVAGVVLAMAEATSGWLAALVPGAAGQAPPATAPAQLELAQKARVHSLLVFGDPTVVALEHFALELSLKGVPADEIINRTNAKGREWRGLRATGAGSDEIILRELSKIRQQIATLSRQMHKRFDGVHHHLDAVLAAMANGIDVLRSDHFKLAENQMELSRLSQATLRELSRVARDVRDLGGQQSDLARLLLAITHAAARAAMATRLAPCHRDYRPADGDVMALTVYLNCVAAYSELAKLLPANQVLPRGADMQTQLLMEQPERSLQLAYRLFLRALDSLGRDTSSLPDTVVSPYAWRRMANVVDDTATKHAEHDIANELDEYASVMRAYRESFLTAQDAVQADIEAYRNGEPSAIGLIIEDAFDAESLDAVMEGILDDYYEDPGHYDGRRNAAGEPEIRIERGPYAWMPLGRFESGIPSWLELESSPSACPATMTIDERHVARKGWTGPMRHQVEWMFRKGGIARFLNGDDLALARAGLGTVHACIYERTTELKNTGLRRRYVRSTSGVKLVFKPNRHFCRDCEDHVIRSYWFRSPLSPRRRSLRVRELLGMMRDRFPNHQRSLPSEYHDEYAAAFSHRQDSLSNFVRRRLLGSVTVDAMQSRLRLADALLRRLFRFALHDAVRSPIVGQLISGRIGLPDLAELVTAAAEDSLAWTVVEVAEEQVQTLEDALRSTGLGDVLSLDPGIEEIQGTSFRFIDIDEER